jgi:hypothetical protein
MDRLREEVRQELLRRERRPQRGDRGVDVGACGDGLAELRDVVGAEEVGSSVRVGADAVRELGRQVVDDPEHEVGAGEIVRQPRLAGLVPCLDGHAPVDDEIAVVVRHDERLVLVGHPLPVAYRLRQHVRHVRAALDGRGGGAVGAGGVHTGEELTDRRQQHTGLAERGQHLPDVAEKGRIRSDDQYGAFGELFPVRVQQIGGPMEGDRGLARSRSALHDEDTALRGADDPVLLGLDGRHDVAHPPGAGAAQRGEQHLVGVVGLVAGAGGVGEVHDLVVQRGDRPPLRGDVPPAAQSHRLVTGGEIERARDGGPPVDQQRSAFRVVTADSGAPDVMGDSVAPVDAAEYQTGVGGIQGRQRRRMLDDADVPLDPRLPARPHLRDRGVQGGFGLVAELVEPLVHERDELLFPPQFLG